MHDKYAYERIEMALHDYSPLRTMAFGMAGLSVVADSLSAIAHAKVRVVRDATGLGSDYQVEGEFPKFGNNDNRVDHLATWVVSTFMGKLRKYPTYRNALHTQSILTITSNVVTAKPRVTRPMGRRRANPLRRAPIRCIGATRTVFMPRRPRWQKFPITMRPTAFHSRRRLCPRASDELPMSGRRT